MPKFKSFEKIQYYDTIEVTITQKIHGTNTQVYIFESENGLDLICGSRNRWVYPDDDHYSFAHFVHKNKQEFIEKLGPGRHFGEWAGPGIHSGEGLKEKTWFLFDWRRFKGQPLPANVKTIPVLSRLYWKNRDETTIDDLIKQDMDFLKEYGSFALSPPEKYMKPEGIVIEIDGNFYKKVFDNQEIAWKKIEKKIVEMPDVSYLLQPLRLEKLLSRDERYLRDYPKSLPSIASDYVKDLQEENQIIGNEDEIKAIKKCLGKQLFPFIKDHISTINTVDSLEKLQEEYDKTHQYYQDPDPGIPEIGKCTCRKSVIIYDPKTGKCQDCGKVISSWDLKNEDI